MKIYSVILWLVTAHVLEQLRSNRKSSTKLIKRIKGEEAGRRNAGRKERKLYLSDYDGDQSEYNDSYPDGYSDSYDNGYNAGDNDQEPWNSMPRYLQSSPTYSTSPTYRSTQPINSSQTSITPTGQKTQSTSTNYQNADTGTRTSTIPTGQQTSTTPTGTQTSTTTTGQQTSTSPTGTQSYYGGTSGQQTQTDTQPKQNTSVSPQGYQSPPQNTQNPQYTTNQNFSQNTQNGQFSNKNPTQRGIQYQNMQANLYPDECDLTVEIFPMYYTPVVRLSTFRLAFSSNCMKKRDIRFELYYNSKETINFNNHPSVVNLNLWGNNFNITYAKPQVIDPFDVMKSLEYRKVNITNTLVSVNPIDATAQNEVFLNPQQRNTFTALTIAKLAVLKGYFKCKLFEKKIHGWELLKRIKDDARKKAEMNRKKMQEATKKARKEAEESIKVEQQQLSDSGRTLTEAKLSFFTPDPTIDDEEELKKDPETYFANEDLNDYNEDDGSFTKKREKLKVKDKNSIWGFATPEPSDYFDDTKLPIESPAPIKDFDTYKKKVSLIMKKEYVEEYRILCSIL